MLTYVSSSYNSNPYHSLIAVSFTGSEKVGREVGKAVQDRFGKVSQRLEDILTVSLFLSLVETMVSKVRYERVDIDNSGDRRQGCGPGPGAVGRGIRCCWHSVSTSPKIWLTHSGQRCTSTRRLYLHRSIAKEFISRLIPIYEGSKLPVGDPLNPSTLIGPLHTPGAVEAYLKTLNGIKSRGGKVLTKREGPIDEVSGFAEGKGGNFVWPVVVQPKNDDPSWKEE